MAVYRDQAIVLRTQKLGEADRIITLLTRERGRIKAVAKGVRKSGSRFGARLEPACHVSLQLFKGRGDLDTVTASMAKWWCSQKQVETADECLQLHGGYGYMHEYPIARAFVDARIERIYAGTSEIMKEIISKRQGWG